MSEKKYGKCPECGAPCEVVTKMDYDGFTPTMPYNEFKYHPQPGAVWVKASERLPGWEIKVKWRDGNNHSCATDGKISFYEMDKPNLEGWEWYDESPAEQPVVSHDAHEKEVMMQAFDKVRQIFEGRQWIMEGRGSYPYNDDRYKEEVRYMYNEFDAIVKDTWANIKSKSIDYRKAIIDEYKAAAEQPGREVEDWISVGDRPLIKRDCNFWELTPDGEKEFIAAVPYHDRKADDPDKTRWWIRHCYIDGEGCLYVKRDDPMDEDVAGWAVSDITHWRPLPEPPAGSGGKEETP